MADSYEITTGCAAKHPHQQGGQHVTKQCVAVMIRHVASGISVTVDTERSQHANRLVAMERLNSLLNTWNGWPHAD